MKSAIKLLSVFIFLISAILDYRFYCKIQKNRGISLTMISFVIANLISLSIFAQNITPPQCYGGKRLLKEFIKENKKLITTILVVAGIIAGLTATDVDNKIVADIKTVVEALSADVHLSASETE